MNVPGHIAVVLAQHHLLTSRGRDEEIIKPLLLAGFFPDLVDKTIRYVFHAMPNGRHYAHNIFSLILLSCTVALIWGKTAGRAWFVGYLGHLLADSDSLVPWFFPLKKYCFPRSRLTFNPTRLILETILLALVLMVRRRSRR